MTPTNEHNLLVISDLHLGEDLRPTATGVSYLRHLALLEQELARFLAHHTAHRLEDRPWRLIVNGDMVDFMSMRIQPEVDGRSTVDSDDGDDDRLYGLGFSERAAQKKMERVIVRHQQVFRALGEFVQMGNELVIVGGNHDVEFRYDSVQRTVVEWLCGLSIGAGAEDEVRRAFAARIQFCPWFYYQENCIYIEHGHQFDEYCSFDYQLQPAHTTVTEPSLDAASRSETEGAPPDPARSGTEPPRRGGRKSRFALSMAHAGMRYFANQIPEYDPHTAESWGVLNYIRWGRTLGMKTLTRICYLYGLLVWKVVEAWYMMRNDSERREVHLQRLRALSRTYTSLNEAKLLALTALHRVPVTRRFFGVLRALFLDRVLMSGAAVGIALGLAVQLEGPRRFWAPIAVIATALFLNEVMGRFRLESPAQKLRAIPRLVQALVGAPLIVFGHSHMPERVALPNGAVYFNTGTWASDDERLAFTHLRVIGHGAGRHAELRQWRDGASAPFDVEKRMEDGSAEPA